MTDWLNDLQSRSKPDKVKPLPVYITVRNPRNDDLGEIREGCYGVLPDGSVMLCDHKGNPKGRQEYVGENERPAHAAWRLLREQFEHDDKSDDFHRPLHYPKSRVPCWACTRKGADVGSWGLSWAEQKSSAQPEHYRF